jgi:hypothetical protein
LKKASHDWLISIVYHLNTLRPSTFILSNLVLIFTPEYAIKISCGSSGTPGITKEGEIIKNLNKGEFYKYLGINQSNHIQHSIIKENLEKQFYLKN